MSLDHTGLPSDFVRMLAIKVDPYNDRPPASPTQPLDNFFRALMRAQSFRTTREAAEASQQPGPRKEPNDNEQRQN